MSDTTPRSCGLPDTAPPCIGCTCPARATWDAAASRARARLALRVGNARAEIDEALDGIDRDEMDGGWWPTSTGVEAGAERLARVHAALASIFAPEPQPPHVPIDECPYTFAHTRDFCGRAGCRES